MSPTVTIEGPYRVFFYANEVGEPPHIHVRRDRCVAKFWLGPVALARSKRFSARDAGLEAVTRAHEDELMEAWREFFSH